jgi:hypothetical protein
METNHSRKIGANMNPTLAVPNCCMLNKPTSITKDMIVTISANRFKNSVTSHPPNRNLTGSEIVVITEQDLHQPWFETEDAQSQLQ